MKIFEFTSKDQQTFLLHKLHLCNIKIIENSSSENTKLFYENQIRNSIRALKKLTQNQIIESEEKFEVYDRKTGERVSGPYATAKRARLARDKKDLEYGAVRYAVRTVKEKTPMLEAVRILPLVDKDFDLVKELLNRPIPAIVAPIYIAEIIDDDELNDQLLEVSKVKPSADVRHLIVEWIKRVMPDQLHRFVGENRSKKLVLGQLSPIHGYDS